MMRISAAQKRCGTVHLSYRKGKGMNITILGAAGFIGTNLTLELAKDPSVQLTLIDRDMAFFETLRSFDLPNVSFRLSSFSPEEDLAPLLTGAEVVYHLVSTTVPTTSNLQISEELTANVVMTSRLLEACVSCGVRKVVFISSGGTVYGKETGCPLHEDTPTYPISSYGIQKVTIEKLLYLYHYLHGLDYRVVRLANPYGPYQRPNGILGAVTTFTYKALRHEPIQVYGDGSVIRDFIYIDDAVRGILQIANGSSPHRTFNLGSGCGTSIREVLETIEKTLSLPLDISYQAGRKADVPQNYLDISRYEEAYGKLEPLSLPEGILRTAEFMKSRKMV